MQWRLLMGLAIGCAVAMAQTWTVERLSQFIQSSVQLKQSDKDVAEYLSKVNLSEKLDDRAIERLQAAGVGPRTLHALMALRDRSAHLAAPKAAAPAPVYVPPPPPSAEEQAAIIGDVREYALNYSHNLPDFICTEVVKRSTAPKPRSGDPAWRDGDTLLIKLSYFDQKENYRLITINNSVTRQDYEKVGGAKSFGDFGSLMRGIFEPASQARFAFDHRSRLRECVVLAFRYHVDQANSRYEVRYEDGRHIVPAYGGQVLVDEETHQVLRVTVKAEGIPADFPVKSAETRLDYDFQELSGQRFLLPLQAMVEMSGDDYLTKNDEQFRIYAKYSADSSISFDTVAPPPLPEDKIKEKK
jgi:hypothetical protein